MDFSVNELARTFLLDCVGIPFHPLDTLVKKAFSHSEGIYLADSGKARGCSKNSVVIN